MRALQRENGVAGQRTADLRERLNFQCFKYELLVDMVRIRPITDAELCHDILVTKPDFAAHHSCSPAMKHAYRDCVVNTTRCNRQLVRDPTADFRQHQG